MSARWAVAVAAVAAAACGAHAHSTERFPAGPDAIGSSITLYRDQALIEQRVEVDVPASKHAIAHATIGAGVALGDVQEIDLGRLVVSVHLADGDGAGSGSGSGSGGGFGAGTGRGSDDDSPVDTGSDAVPAVDPDDDDDILAPRHFDVAPDISTLDSTHPTTLTFDVDAPAAGHYTFTLVYPTSALTWQAAYTMTTTPARDAVDARGAIAIVNASGIAYPRAHVMVLDGPLGWSHDSSSAQVLGDVTKRLEADPSTHPAHLHDLGRIDVTDGEVRAELYARGSVRALRSVLVFDPIGTALDNAGRDVARDEDLGAAAPAVRPVAESVEIVRDDVRDVGLPGGPARLVERRPDGSLVVLAQGRMFDAPTRVASFDTIPLGVAHDVIGHRTRRDFHLDDDGHRLTEDFAIEVDNRRAHPVKVVLLEHMYRSTNWALGYSSVPAALDGTQEISMRTDVAPNSKQSVMYVVVYWWQDL